MKRSFPEEYETYKNQAPFLFPVPGFAVKTIMLPVRLILKKEEIETAKDVISIFFIYLVILVLLSLLFNSLDLLPRSGLWGFPENVFTFL